MTISGRVYVDLRDVPEDKMRHRAGSIQYAPAGARALLIVGALRVEPQTIWELRKYADRYDIEVLGEPYAVGRWVEALRDGMEAIL